MHLGVFRLEFFQADDVSDFHPVVLRLPKPDRVGVNAMFAGQLCDRCAGIVLSNDRDDLRLGKATLVHGWISLAARLGGNPQLSLAPFSGPIPLRPEMSIAN